MPRRIEVVTQTKRPHRKPPLLKETNSTQIIKLIQTQTTNTKTTYATKSKSLENEASNQSLKCDVERLNCKDHDVHIILTFDAQSQKTVRRSAPLGGNANQSLRKRTHLNYCSIFGFRIQPRLPFVFLTSSFITVSNKIVNICNLSIFQAGYVDRYTGERPKRVSYEAWKLVYLVATIILIGLLQN